MTPGNDVARVREIAASLSNAKRAGLLNQPCRSWWGDRPAAMPRARQTTFALWRAGLCGPPLLSTTATPLTDLGLAVRAYLKQQGPSA